MSDFFKRFDIRKLGLAGTLGLALPYLQHVQVNGRPIGPVINAVAGAVAMVTALLSPPQK